jgi:hypothetical protein
MNEVVSTQNVYIEKAPFSMEEGASGRLGCAVHDCLFGMTASGFFTAGNFLNITLRVRCCSSWQWLLR